MISGDCSEHAVAAAREAMARQERLQHIRREVAHANGTQWPDGDSWIRGYAEDCNWLLSELELAEAALHDLTAEVRAAEPMSGGVEVDDV